MRSRGRDVHRDFMRKLLERLRTNDEIGLGAKIEHDADAIVMNVRVDKPGARLAIRPFFHFRQPRSRMIFTAASISPFGFNEALCGNPSRPRSLSRAIFAPLPP